MDYLDYSTPPGSLRIRVAEGTDLADGLPTHIKQIKQCQTQSFKLHSMFFRVELLNESDYVIQSFSSLCQPYKGSGELSFHNEEFFFQEALPTYSIRLSTYFCQHVSAGVSSDQCAGSMLLPLNRLEENVPVTQWYQLTPPRKEDVCIKSAIKFDICFFHNSETDLFESSDRSEKAISPSIGVIQSIDDQLPHATERPAPTSPEIDNGIPLSECPSLQLQPSSLIADSLHISIPATLLPPTSQPRGDKSEMQHSTTLKEALTIISAADISKNLSMNLRSQEDSALNCQNPPSNRSGSQTTPSRFIHKSTSLDPQVTPDSGTTHAVGSNTKRRRSLQSSVPKANTTTHQHHTTPHSRVFLNSHGNTLDHILRSGSGVGPTANGGDREKTGIKVGVIQHAVLIGSSTVDCHPLDAGDTLTWRDSVTDDLINVGTVSGNPDRNHNPYYGESDNPLSSCAGVCIWDQYPPQALLQPHQFLPEKLEWFAFPNGPKEKIDCRRPAPELSSFVLRSDTGELEVSYCVCLTFYIRGDFIEARDDKVAHATHNKWWASGEPKRGRNVEEREKLSENSPRYKWIGVCLCLMSTLPFVSELMSLLSTLYQSSILHTLLERERKATIEHPRTGDKYLQLGIRLCDVFESLCYDTPIPIPGYMDVLVRVDALCDSVKCDKSVQTIKGKSFRFSLQGLHMFPQCAYSIEKCIHRVGARTLVDLLYHAFSEHKILLHSDDPSVPPMICECLRILMYPLQWCSVYIPTVPSLLLDLVEAPVPFILGISTTDLDRVDNGALSSIVLVDCDMGTIRFPPLLNPPCRFEVELDRWCVTAVKEAMISDFKMKKCENNAENKITKEVSSEGGCENNYLIQAVVFDCILSMLCHLPECVYNLNSGFPQLNLDMLLEGYSPPSSALFIRALSTTQAFHRMISNIHRPELSMFVQCAASMSRTYRNYDTAGDEMRRPNKERRCMISSQMFPLEEPRFYSDKGNNHKENAMRKRMTAPYSLFEDENDSFSRKIYSAVDIKQNNTPSQDKTHLNVKIFPRWVTSGEADGTDNSIQSNLFRVVCRYQEVLGCFNGMTSLFSPIKLCPAFVVEVTRTAVGMPSQEDMSSNTAIFPPLCFSEVFSSARQRYCRYWRIDDLMSKLKKQHAGMMVSSDETLMRKRLFRLLTTCKVNQKLLQLKRVNGQLDSIDSDDCTDIVGNISHVYPQPPSPSSPNDRAVKRLHFEYMYGSDDITRLVLKIIPVRHSEADLDEELVAKMQFHSNENTAGIFALGDARRRMIRALKGYSMQLAINFVGYSSYQDQYREANKRHITLPDKRLKSLANQFPVEVHVIAFGYLHQLFKVLLQACATHNDYLTAYKALEISGYYYHVHLAEVDTRSCNTSNHNTPDRHSCKSPVSDTESPPLAKNQEHPSINGVLRKLSPPRTPEREIKQLVLVTSGHLVQSLRSRVCLDPLFANLNLWRIVINDVMSNQYCPQNSADENKDRASNVYDVLKPVLTHMIECGLILIQIMELLSEVINNFDIQDETEKEVLVERSKLLWQVGRESIRKSFGGAVNTGRDANKEENLLLVRRVLHSSKDNVNIINLGTPKFSSSPVDIVAARSFDFSRTSSPALPPPPVLGPQTSTFSMNPFDNDALFITDDDDDIEEGRLNVVDSECVTDTDGHLADSVHFTFAGQPRHESSLGSTYPKQLTSMHSSCVTCVDIAKSQFDYVLESHLNDKKRIITPTLAQSHHLISGDAEGNVYVTNWCSSTSRNNLLGKQKHTSPVLAVVGLPNDYIASACTSGELKVWNLVADGHDSVIGNRAALSRKKISKAHKPFAGTRGGGGISSLVLAQSSGGVQWTDVWGGPPGRTNSNRSSSDVESKSWLLAVGGARGGLKVYHGDTDHPNSAGGAEVLSVESPDRSTISSIHLAGSLEHKSSHATFSGQLPTDTKSAKQSFNSLLKYSVHSRIQALLSSPNSRDGIDCQGRPSSSGFLFSGSNKGTVSIFDLASSTMTNDSCVFSSPQECSHTALVSGVLPVPYTGGKHVVSAGYDRLVKFWDVRVSGRDSCCLDLVGAGGAVTHVAIDATNPHRIIGVSSENVVRIWDTRLLHYGEPFQTFHVGHTDRICDILQVDGLLITGSRDGSVMSWNINTGQCVQTLRCDSSTVVDGFASAESPHRKMTFSQHASLACTRLLHIPGIHRDDEAGMNRTIDNSALSNHSDSYSTLNSRKEQYTDAMLVTGDYGGTVKVWKGVTRSVCKL